MRYAVGKLGKAQREESDRALREIQRRWDCVMPTGPDADPSDQPFLELRQLSVYENDLDKTLANWGAAGWTAKTIAMDSTYGHSKGTVFVIVERRHVKRPPWVHPGPQMPTWDRPTR